MIRYFTGLTAGLAIAYLTAPQRGKVMRRKVANFSRNELEGIKLIHKQWYKTISRAKQAWEQIKQTTGF